MKKGFTLVEMLVSITILSIGLLSLGVLFPAGMRATLLTKMNTQAIEYCQQEIERLRTLDFDDSDLSAGTHGPESLSFENNEDVFSRSYVVTNDYPVSDMKKIVVNVNWSIAGKPHAQSIMTYIAKK